MIVISSKLDPKTQQLVRTLRTGSGQKLRVFGGLDFDYRQMYSVTQYGKDLIVSRVKAGLNVNDQPFKPLTKRYAIQKSKLRKGNRRNLTLTNDMLSNVSVRSVSEKEGRIDLTKANERMKARINEQIDPWWGWSTKDLAKLTQAAAAIFDGNVQNIGLVAVGSSRNARPTWTSGGVAGRIAGVSGRLAA